MIPQDFQKYIRSKEFKDLLAQFQEATMNGDDRYFDADDLLDIAEYFHVKGKPDEAEKATDYMLRLFPDNEKALLFKGRQAVMDGDIELAEHYAAQIKTEELSDTIYLRAEIMVCKDKAEEANEYILKFYNSLPKENFDEQNAPSSHLNIYSDDEDLDEEEESPKSAFALDIALMYCDHREWQLSEEWLDRVQNPRLKQDGDYIEVKAILLTAKGEYTNAITLWNKYIDLDAYSVRAWLQLAQCQFHQGLCQEALHGVEYAEAIDPNLPDVYLAKGNCNFSLGNNETALECFQKFLSMCPGDVQGELLTASILFAMERYEEGYQHIVVAIESMENSDFLDYPEYMRVEVYRQASFLCSAMGRIDQALSYADKLMLCGVSEEKSTLIKAGIYLESQKPKEAFDMFNKALQQGNHEPEMYISIGCMLVDASLMDTGYKMLSDTLRILEDSGADTNFGYERLAYAALVIGKYDEFLKALEKSIVKNPSDTVTIFSSLFPKDLPISEYLEYARTHEIKDTRYTRPNDNQDN